MTQETYYETMYILRPDIPEEEVETHVKKYSEMLVQAGVEVLDSQMRGKRRLAYPISKHKEGVYVQLSHQGDGQHIEVLERAMRLSEDVIRYLTVIQNGPLPTPRSTSNDKDKSEEAEKKDAKDEEKNTKEEKANKDKESENPSNSDKAEESKEEEQPAKQD